MKVKVLRTLRTDAGMVRRDAVAELPAATARSLIKRGLAVEATTSEPAVPVRRVRNGNQGASAPKGD